MELESFCDTSSILSACRTENENCLIPVMPTSEVTLKREGEEEESNLVVDYDPEALTHLDYNVSTSTSIQLGECTTSLEPYKQDLLRCTQNNPSSDDESILKCKEKNDQLNSSKPGKREKRTNRCPICLKLFNHPSNLVTHFRIHSGERPFSCPHCPKSFTQASTLDRHILIHTGEKAYKCPYCAKSFSRKFSLSSHVHTHTGVKSYMCEYCSKCFRDRSALNKHFLIHTGEKQYMCHLCSKCFSYKSALNTHMRTHSGEKPFQCQECSRCFSDKNNLKAHYIVHSNEKKFKCDMCTKCFKHSSGLKKHIISHSKLQMKQFQIISNDFNDPQTSNFETN